MLLSVAQDASTLPPPQNFTAGTNHSAFESGPQALSKPEVTLEE
jgi:hypothetical protein